MNEQKHFKDFIKSLVDAECLDEYCLDNQTMIDVIMRFVKARGTYIQYVPKHMITQEIASAALDSTLLCVQYVPAQYITEGVVRECIQKHPVTVCHIPSSLLTVEDYVSAVNRFAPGFAAVPLQLRDAVISKLETPVKEKLLELEGLSDVFLGREK